MNWSKEEEQIITILLLACGGIGSIVLGVAVPAFRQGLVDFHILAAEGVVVPLFGDDIGLDWARIIIGGAVFLLVVGLLILNAVVRLRRRRRLMRITDAL